MPEDNNNKVLLKGWFVSFLWENEGLMGYGSAIVHSPTVSYIQGSDDLNHLSGLARLEKGMPPDASLTIMNYFRELQADKFAEVPLVQVSNRGKDVLEFKRKEA